MELINRQYVQNQSTGAFHHHRRYPYRVRLPLQNQFIMGGERTPVRPETIGTTSLSPSAQSRSSSVVPAALVHGGEPTPVRPETIDATSSSPSALSRSSSVVTAALVHGGEHTPVRPETISTTCLSPSALSRSSSDSRFFIISSEKNYVWKNLTLRDFFKKKFFFRLELR